MWTRLSICHARAILPEIRQSESGMRFVKQWEIIRFVNTCPANTSQPESGELLGQPLNGSLRNNVIHNF